VQVGADLVKTTFCSCENRTGAPGAAVHVYVGDSGNASRTVVDSVTDCPARITSENWLSGLLNHPGVTNKHTPQTDGAWLDWVSDWLGFDADAHASNVPNFAEFGVAMRNGAVTVKRLDNDRWTFPLFFSCEDCEEARPVATCPGGLAVEVFIGDCPYCNDGKVVMLDEDVTQCPPFVDETSWTTRGGSAPGYTGFAIGDERFLVEMRGKREVSVKLVAGEGWRMSLRFWCQWCPEPR
jgi:hypothetical protein